MALSFVSYLEEARHEIQNIDVHFNPPEAYTAHDGLAILYARLGEKEKALQALEQACKERQVHLTEIGVEPAFDTLRSDPRFADLLQRIGFPPSARLIGR